MKLSVKLVIPKYPMVIMNNYEFESKISKISSLTKAD